MTDNDTGGKTVDSPTTDDTGQVTSTTDQDTNAGDSGTTDQGQKADSQSADTGGGEGGKDTKSDLPDKDALPFDQHPKWISARKAEQRLNQLIDEQGYDSIDDLVRAAEEHKSLKGLIGDRDPEQVVSDFEEFQRVKKFWAEQDAAKQEADESPEETISRLKKEKQELIDGKQQEEDDRKAVEEDRIALETFDSSLQTRVNSLADRTDTEKSLLLEIFGVDNEMASVNIKDPTAINRAWDACLTRFDQYLSDVRQEAIDKYVAGKSDITPIGKSEGPTKTDSVTTSDESAGMAEDETAEQFGKRAKSTLFERLTKAQAT